MAKSATSWFSVTFRAEVEVTKISGRDVPIETIVRPMTTSGIPPLLASPFAPSIKKSADTTNNPNASNKIILAQNFNAAQRETGRMNAGLGVVITINSDQTLKEIWPKNSGFFTRADSRRIVLEDFGNDGNIELLLGQNNGELEVFRSNVNKNP